MTALILGSQGCGRTPLEEARLMDQNQGDRGRAESIAKEAFRVHTKEKDYAKAGGLWLDAARADPKWWKPYYNLACVSSLTGKKAEAIEFLKLALTREPPAEMLRWMKGDGDLAAVRDTPEFRALLEEDELARLAGSWGGTLQEWMQLLPPPYNAYKDSDYLSLDIKVDGRFEMSGTNGKLTGNCRADGQKLRFTLNEADIEVIYVEGTKQGGHRRIHQESGFAYVLQQITHAGKQITLLCVDWENENFASPTGGKRECYSKD